MIDADRIYHILRALRWWKHSQEEREGSVPEEYYEILRDAGLLEMHVDSPGAHFLTEKGKQALEIVK